MQTEVIFWLERLKTCIKKVLLIAFLLKYGFYKKYFFYAGISDQLNISWPFLSSLLGGFAVPLLLHPPKNDDKNGKDMFN